MFKLKEFADDNFIFDENGRKLSKRVENTVGKGEIACYEQFLLSPQCFQKACFPGASKGVIVWEWVKMLSAICFNSDQSKILSSGNGLKVAQEPFEDCMVLNSFSTLFSVITAASAQM